MEFKVIRHPHPLSDTYVDIGTEWNLKLTQTSCIRKEVNVDIGTEWNLKISKFINHSKLNPLI